MSYCALSILLGLLIPVTGVFPPGSCDGYQNITEPWRNIGFTGKSYQGYPNNDDRLVNYWWRFTGIGGNKVITLCVVQGRGGTNFTTYIPFEYPKVESELPTTGTAYGNHDCTEYSVNISVALCPGGFYVYKPLTHPYSQMGYVTYHPDCNSESCGPLANCTYDGGCVCVSGYEIPPEHKPVADSYGCVDIDECERFTAICGTNSICNGVRANRIKDKNALLHPVLLPDGSNPCIDIDECLNKTVCGPDANCNNALGSYNCICFSGYQTHIPDVIASPANPCTDIDECSHTPSICGETSVCTNAPATFYCSCPNGFFPSTGVLWEIDVTFCQTLQDILDAIKPKAGQTKDKAFFEYIDEDLSNNTGVVLNEMTVANIFSSVMEVSGFGPLASSIKVSSKGDGESGSLILGISERVVAAMVSPAEKETKKALHTSVIDLSLQTIGPESDDDNSASLSAKGQTMEINLKTLAKSHNGSAAAALMTLGGMESLLSHRYFKTENKTEMYSDVFTAVVPSINTTNLTEPVNFTIQHKKRVPESGLVTCVYWEDKSKKNAGGQEEGGGTEEETRRWSVEGCWVVYTDENYTVCSCSHLSTFALIMQIGEPPPQDDFLEWLTRICVIIGLFFLALAIFTFLLCSWNPKINNTARLNLCLSLFFSHLLLLWNDRYVKDELGCIVMAGLLHFLVVASFVWMQLEAVQLYLLVRRLTKVQVIQKDGLPRPALYLIGYGVPFVIVGVSALVYSDGYGATGAGVCWLSRERNFNWALKGPVITILASNCVLFCASLWSLRVTLINMKSGASKSKDTWLIMFKIAAQFVILGCTWILGFYQTNVFIKVLFILLNSQQGTFLFIVHCLLNKEVRAGYMKWLTCKCEKGNSLESPAPSINDGSFEQLEYDTRL